jgi:hypothetical protein
MKKLLLIFMIFILTMLISGCYEGDYIHIKETVHKHGYYHIYTEPHGPFESIGPYHIRTKEQRIYRVEYKDRNGNWYEAWVRTGVFTWDWYTTDDKQLNW